MKEEIQKQYEERLTAYAGLIHGNEPPGLAAKLAIYTALLLQHEKYGENLSRIDPLLLSFLNALEIDLHLSMARLLEAPGRSDRNFFRFLKYCRDNRTLISWRTGSPSDAMLQAQQEDLERHRVTIDAIKARRDKFFAHMDKQYFLDPGKLYDDFPISKSDVIKLANCIISIISKHQDELNGGVNFHLGQIYTIAVDNMVRNLLAGRRVNFPGQIDDL